MGRITYDIPAIRNVTWLPGNAGTAIILTPQKGTASETKTHTTTLNPFYFGKMAVRLKRLQYLVTTAATAAGQTLALDVYKGTSSVGSLSVTTESAGSQALMSSDLDVELTATDYIRVYAKSTTTANNSNSAVGTLWITWEELFTA